MPSLPLPLFSLLTTILLTLPTPSLAVSWYYLRYYPSSSSQSFTALSGQMVVPALPRAGTYYLWPGLQPTDNSGVYQNVLDGKSGTWWLGSGWCCGNPDLAWGSGFNCYADETVSFSNTWDTPGDASAGWTTSTTHDSTGTTKTDAFALGSKSFNQALFAIELYDEEWDFGALEFRDVVIKSTGTDTAWCTSDPENYNEATAYSISGASATVDESGEGVTCTIERIVLESPA
ncbi:hypothetical protein HDK77DRAFT_447158 [Phyllosticta capitalensis]|uniref:Uncharacterized protein n=1 Tax=Phyllosticta capitalensis TaxID=121624 RepID=A0ABR1YID1_9PEZI